MIRFVSTVVGGNIPSIILTADIIYGLMTTEWSSTHLKAITIPMTGIIKSEGEQLFLIMNPIIFQKNKQSLLELEQMTGKIFFLVLCKTLNPRMIEYQVASSGMSSTM